MSLNLPDLEQRILAVIQNGLPLSRTPYKDLAQKAGIRTGQLLGILKKWKKEGKLRRSGAIVNHFKVGLNTNAMIVWQVEKDKVEMIGNLMAGCKEISHVCQRETDDNWPFNLYSMVHGKTVREIESVIEKIKNVDGVLNFRVLYTQKELKKTAPIYTVK